MSRVFNRKDFLERGLYLDRMVNADILKDLIVRLRPIKTNFELVRVGGAEDGGYLLPNDLSGITACFSPGVSDNALFEKDLLEKYGINSHLADWSVKSPPAYFSPLSFTKKFIGSYSNDKYMTLDSWVKNSPEYGQLGDFLLQIDIEGGEYPSMLSVSDEVLMRFRIIAIEIHDIAAWGQPQFFEIVNQFFLKLSQFFYIIHNHPNNHLGTINLCGVECPQVCEMTFLRKDRATDMGYQKEIPNALDRPCTRYRPNWNLPDFWVG